MKNNKINPILSHTANILIPNLIFPTIEYQKENLVDSSYIFAPNHTNNIDGGLIWSLLSKDYDIDTFMYKEFWLNFPTISKVLPLFQVYPITRDKVVIKEIKTELQKLKDKNHSLVIFPQGRHVDPNVMLHLPEYHLNTLPLGAFYFASTSSKSIVPIYMEPQKIFKRNVVIYGQPLKPQDYNISKNSKENLINLAKAWLSEINNLYLKACELECREMRPYQLQEKYFDASGLRPNLSDPNIIANYLDEISKLAILSAKTGNTNIEELGKMLSFSKDTINTILKVKDTYENCLVRRK